MDEQTEKQKNAEQPIGADRSIDLAIEQGDASSNELIVRRHESRRLFWVALLLILVVVVAAASMLLFVVLQQAKKPTTDPLAAATHFDSAQKLIETVQPYLAGKVMEVKASSGVSALDVNGYYVYGAPIFKEDDSKFSVLPTTVTGSGFISDSTQANTNYESLADFFTTNKFVERLSQANVKGTVSDTDEDIEYIKYAEYESSAQLCAIRHADATPTKLAAHIVSVGCADKASYADAAKALQPFYNSYIEGNSEVASNLVFGLLQKGGSGGYNYQLLYQEDAGKFSDGEKMTSLIGYYYKKSNDANWTYLTSTRVDEVPYCSEFKTDVLKKAFKDVDCYDDQSQKESTVQQRA